MNEEEGANGLPSPLPRLHGGRFPVKGLLVIFVLVDAIESARNVL